MSKTLGITREKRDYYLHVIQIRQSISPDDPRIIALQESMDGLEKYWSCFEEQWIATNIEKWVRVKLWISPNFDAQVYLENVSGAPRKYQMFCAYNEPAGKSWKSFNRVARNSKKERKLQEKKDNEACVGFL